MQPEAATVHALVLDSLGPQGMQPDEAIVHALVLDGACSENQTNTTTPTTEHPTDNQSCV
jgi:hypothetical protein